MSKGVASVVSIIILVSFAFSCYLMTTVNPPPLENEKDPKPKELSVGRRSEDDELPTNPLESLTPFYRFNPSSISAILNNITTEVDNNPIFNFPLDMIKKVIPPLYPLKFTPTTRTTTQEILSTQLNDVKDTPDTNEGLEANTIENAPFPNSDFIPGQPEKGRRRSVNNFLNKVIEGNSSSVILKIIDKYGQVRIEIKVNPDYSSIVKDDFFGVGPDLEMVVKKHNTRDERGELAYNTEIKILPNDTVIVDSNDFLADERIVTTDITENKSTYKYTELGNATETTILPNNTYFLRSKDFVTTAMIDTESKVKNKSTAMIFPTTEKNITEINIHEKWASSELKLKSTLKPSYGVKVDSEFINLKNRSNHRVDFTKSIKNETSENFLGFRLKVKSDAKKDTIIEKNMMNKSDTIMSSHKKLEKPALKNRTKHNVVATNNLVYATKKSGLQFHSKVKDAARKDVEVDNNIEEKIDAIKITPDSNNTKKHHVVTSSTVNYDKKEIISPFSTNTAIDPSKYREIDKNIGNKSDAINRTLLLDTKNNLSRHFGFTNAINLYNETKEKTLRFRPEFKSDGEHMETEQTVVTNSNPIESIVLNNDTKNDMLKFNLKHKDDAREHIVQNANSSVLKPENKFDNISKPLRGHTTKIPVLKPKNLTLATLKKKANKTVSLQSVERTNRNFSSVNPASINIEFSSISAASTNIRFSSVSPASVKTQLTSILPAFTDTQRTSIALASTNTHLSSDSSTTRISNHKTTTTHSILSSSSLAPTKTTRTS